MHSLRPQEAEEVRAFDPGHRYDAAAWGDFVREKQAADPSRCSRRRKHSTTPARESRPDRSEAALFPKATACGHTAASAVAPEQLRVGRQHSIEAPGLLPWDDFAGAGSRLGHFTLQRRAISLTGSAVRRRLGS
jgi:hypothetical protein